MKPGGTRQVDLEDDDNEPSTRSSKPFRLRPAMTVDNEAQALLEDDLYAGLLAYAPMPRLPLDAPAEIAQLTVDIGREPWKVYTVHQASRRHGFHSLVAKYADSPALAYWIPANDSTQVY